MKKSLLILFAFLMSGGLAWAQSAPVDIEFILDASGSMAAQTEGRSQMDIAKQSLKSTLVQIPPNVNVALRVYAHRIPKADKEKSCVDTELAIPFGSLNTAAFSAKVDALQPNGYTPIAYSLKEAARDFLGKESEHVILLLSDGEETCGGDPVAEAKNLLGQGFKVTIHTIGFRVDAATRAQLAAISSATGGSYYDAKDAASLTANLAEATQKALVIAKEKEKGRGQEIRGGDQYDSAVLIEKEVEYRLDHHQKQNQYDYFYVPLKKGQSMIVTLTTQDHGVNINNEQAEENVNPYAGFRVVGPGPDYPQILDQTILGTQHGRKQGWAIATAEGRYYLLIGNTYHHQHKDSPFKIEIKEHFDANSGTDASDVITEALKLQRGEYPSNWIHFNQDKDYFQVEAQKGEKVSFKVTPASMESSFSLTVYDQDRVKLENKWSQNRGAVLRLDEITAPSSGPLYLEVVAYLSNEFPLEYALSIQKGEGPGQAEEEPAKPYLPEGAVSKTTGTSESAQQTAAQANPNPPAKSSTVLILALVSAILIIAALGMIIVYQRKQKRP